jgi:hypothetical protein
MSILESWFQNVLGWILEALPEKQLKYFLFKEFMYSCVEALTDSSSNYVTGYPHGQRSGCSCTKRKCNHS